MFCVHRCFRVHLKNKIIRDVLETTLFVFTTIFSIHLKNFSRKEVHRNTLYKGGVTNWLRHWDQDHEVAGSNSGLDISSSPCFQAVGSVSAQSNGMKM